MRKIWLFGAILLAAFAVACSSSNDGDSSDDGGDEATATTEAAGTTEATETATAEGADSGGDDNALDFLALFGDTEYTVSYETQATSPDGDFTGSMTLYQGSDRQRTDLALTTDGEEFEVISITTSEGSLFCTPAEETCLAIPTDGAFGAGANPGDFALDALEELQGQDGIGRVTPIGQRTIAGTEAECFEITEGDSGTGTACISSEGVPLFTDFNDGAGSTWLMEATEYSTSVSDSDFEAPFPVTELPF